MSVLNKIERFYTDFKGEKGIVGKSFCGRNIYFFKVSVSATPVLICQYAIHAREYVTALLCLKQIESYLSNKRVGTVYFIPAVNPDGIDIAERVNPLYKANARGVDLNVNFDARWSKGEKNVFCAGQENFVGEHPFSEAETVALRDFTLNVNANATISYHAKGEEIYYEFFQSESDMQRDYRFAKLIADCTGYQIKSTPNSCGGYKDWCIERLKIPALTIEVGNDELIHPIGEEYLNEIYTKNSQVVIKAMQFLTENKCK